jgi:hypothetical protein
VQSLDGQAFEKIIDGGVVILFDPYQGHRPDPHRHLQPDLYHRRNHYHISYAMVARTLGKTTTLSAGEQMVSSAITVKTTFNSWNKIL